MREQLFSSRSCTPSLRPLSLAVLAAVAAGNVQAQQSEPAVLPEVVVTAEQELKESLGVSVITAEDLEQRPVSDLSELLRREPGVNLTGNAASGMRGNRRQIDLRGMGPDNTLVLIDGQPANSRNASRQSWTGERDTDGDTDWVPPEAIERIEILRGPAAARYGSGAMGGVVNIITKRTTDTLTGAVSHHHTLQQDSDEGNSRRTTFLLSGPLGPQLGFRLYGGYSKTDPDDININRGHAYESDGITTAAGKTGERSRFINALLKLDISARQSLELEASASRKADLYSGDTQNNNSYATLKGGSFIPVTDLYGSETTVVHRNSLALTHRGQWGWGNSRLTASVGDTRNNRATEGLFGGPEGAFLSETAAGGTTRYTSKYKESRLEGEVNVPLQTGSLEHVLTFGGEILHESLDDPGSTRVLTLGKQTFEPTALPGRNGQTKLAYTSHALYVEDNLHTGNGLTLVPTLRLNHHEEFGTNLSPGLTLTYALNNDWSVKGGIARAYKTPSLYQANPNYLLYSRGIGCRGNVNAAGGCYLQGNADLKSETSINKEIGIAYDNGQTRASLTFFQNDYKNKIIAGVEQYGQVAAGKLNPYLQRWENIPEAVVSGLEGNFSVPLGHGLDWNTNFTYMIESKDKTFDQPLSIIPEYTVNSWLDWAATDRLSLQANVTFYGKQEPAKFDIRRGVAIENAPNVDPYALVGLSAGYKVNKNLQLRAGVNNLFDKKLYRAGLNSGTRVAPVLGAGARTYNEHGRAFFLSLTARF